MRRFRALPAQQFPSISRYAAELTSGRGHERFDFTLGLIVANLATDGAGQPRWTLSILAGLFGLPVPSP